MGIVEAAIFLVAPTLEIILSLAFFLVEGVVWLFILFIYLLRALVTWSRPKFPARYTFTKAREKVHSAANKWRKNKAKRGEKGENS